VWHHSLLLMNGFNKNRGCCFLVQAMLSEGFPFHQFTINSLSLGRPDGLCLAYHFFHTLIQLMPIHTHIILSYNWSEIFDCIQRYIRSYILYARVVDMSIMNGISDNSCNLFALKKQTQFSYLFI